MGHCYIYIRVSTDEQAQEGFSLENQLLRCREFANSKELIVENEFIEDGRTARNMNRPALQELIRSVKEKPVEAIIFYKIDRAFRNTIDFGLTRKQFTSLSVKLLSVIEGDVSTGIIGNIFASIAEWESEMNGQRTRDALMQKFREGWQPSPPPLGYMSIGGDRERKTCKPDPNVAPIIVDLFQMYATGNFSILEIQDWLSSKNVVSRTGTGLGHSVINTILNNPFYYGLIRWKGEAKVGNHMPIITKELFDTCQYVLGKHRSFLVRRRIHDFLLRGFLYCSDCGQRYTAEWHFKERFTKRNGKIAYYHCPKMNRNGCPAPYVEMSDIESQVEKEFKKMQFNEEFIRTVIEKTKEVLEENRKFSSSNLQGILNKKTALEIRRNSLEDALLDGVLDRETFKRRHNALQQEILNLNKQISELDNKGKIDIDLIEEVLAFTRNIHKAYIEAPKFLKRHYLRFFFEKIIVKNRRINKVVPTPVFKILKNRHEIIIRTKMLRG